MRRYRRLLLVMRAELWRSDTNVGTTATDTVQVYQCRVHVRPTHTHTHTRHLIVQPTVRYYSVQAWTAVRRCKQRNVMGHCGAILTGENGRTVCNTCPSAILRAVNSPWTDLVSNPGLHNDLPATKLLIRGTSHVSLNSPRSYVCMCIYVYI